MFEYFSDPVIKIVELARTESIRLGAYRIEPEHLLLALITEGVSTASKILRSNGATVIRARREIAAHFSSYAPESDAVVLGVRSEKAVEFACSYAKERGFDRIDAEHLLAGLIAEEQITHPSDGFLSRLELDKDYLRKAIDALFY